MTTFVDSNVLIDIAVEDPLWRDWSEQALADEADQGVLVINQIVYAEVSVAYASVEELDAAFPRDGYSRETLPWQAGFLAGKAFLSYRRRGGTKTAPMPDFYIGAHALVAGHRLLTRDAKRYRTYFPRLKLISP